MKFPELSPSVPFDSSLHLGVDGAVILAGCCGGDGRVLRWRAYAEPVEQR